MINLINIKNVASYDAFGVEIKDLKPINFFYGANGCGKTTISRVIANPSTYLHSNVNWQNNLPLKCYVYNRDFVDLNFSSQRELKGIFTLGEDTLSTKKAIEENKKEEEKLQNEINGLNQNLNEKRRQKIEIEQQFENDCWEIKLEYDEIFREAFDGSRGSKVSFSNKCKAEITNSSQLHSYHHLEEKANKIFHGETIKLQSISTFEFGEIEQFEKDKILTTKIIGKDDIDIAQLYKKLGNTDWVKRGKDYLKISDDICPFCQQKTIDSNFISELEEYFDETYLTQTNKLKLLKDSYEGYVKTKIGSIGKVIEFENQYVDRIKLEDLKEIIEAKLKANLVQLENKIKEPTIVINLESLHEKFTEFKNQIADINKLTNEHNKIIDNLANEKKQLKQEIWRLVIEDLKSVLANYNSKTVVIDKAIAGLTVGIESNTQSLRAVKVQLAELSNKITSVQPTVNKINVLLKGFAFNSFLLSEDKVTKGQYQIIRKNGEPTGRSLSEGEKTFITFLYFYHLLMGSQDSGTITENRIVVFDDPISSLDSNVLFIVSNLIRKLIEQVRSKTGSIKQIFILTHNTYFHKEVSFNKGKGTTKLSDESFWIVRKENDLSKVISKETNPIKTSYELLWEEVREKKDSASITLHNTLRRILENYFKILGNITLEDIVNEFEDEEKIICGSLISWLHDGSHFISDDLYVDSNPDVEQKYFKVFQEIFKKKGHEAHYKMMMLEE